MSTQLQTTTNNKAELIIDMLGKEQSGFRDLFKTQKAFDKFKSNFRLMTVKNPDLLNKLMTPDGSFKTVEGKRTLFMALYQAAHDGLCVDGKRAALVPFSLSVGSGDDKQKIDTIQYFPMVYGIREKVFEYTEMLLEAQIVYSNDLFEWEQGDNPKLIHKPSLELDDNARPLAVYAVARKDGKVVDRVVMRIGEINKIMKGSKAGFKQKWVNNKPQYDEKGNPIGEVIGIWKDHWEEMAKKTAIRRLSKQLPLVDEVESIIETVDQYYDEQSPRKDVTPVNNDNQPQNFANALEQQPANNLDTVVNGVDQATGEVIEPQPIEQEFDIK